MTEGQNGKQCKIISLILVVLVGVVVAEMGGVQGGSTGRRSIKVSEGAGRLKIALFADLHFGENAWTEWGPLQDVHSIKVMSYVLHHETPDFVIYLGDVITANNIPIANASLYWDQAVSPTRDKGIPWASIFGNHDDAQFVWPKDWFSTTGIPPLNCSSSSSGDESCSFMGMTRLQLMDHDITSNKLSFDITSNKLSFSQNGPKDLWPSVSNYAIQISSSNDSKTPVAFLYFLDSGGGSYPEVISNAQVSWFNRTAQEINPESRVPEIIFWHVPSKAYDSVAPGLSISKPCVGSINEESVASQEEEHGMMKALEARSSVQAVFVGHNHGLDWCCPYKNFWLCFARHTGYGGYGSWARGARMLEIKEKPFSLKSWITMEDGNVHSHVDLSS